MENDLCTATAALDSLTVQAVRMADEQTLQKFYHLTDHWHDVAAAEHARRADPKKPIKYISVGPGSPSSRARPRVYCGKIGCSGHDKTPRATEAPEA